MIELLQASVEAGEYASTDDAVQDALRLWRRDREELAERLDEIRARIKRSIEDGRPTLTSDDVRRAIDALHRETVKAHEREAS